MPTFPQIAVVPAVCLISLSCCTQPPLQPALCDPDNMARFRPIMFYNCVPVGETDPYAEEKKEFSGAAEKMKLLSADEKALLAQSLVREFDKAVTALGLNLASPDFITEFALATQNTPAVEAADTVMWDDMLGWQNVLCNAMKQLPPELQQKLEHEYMPSLMDCYAAFMIVRYAELNESLPATTRAQARGVVALIVFHADGEYGHRDFGVYDYPGYIPMLPDYSRVPRPDVQEVDN